MTKRNLTRKIKVGSTFIGGGEQVVLQSMCATKTVDIAATAAAAELLRDAGAMLVRIAVDTTSDAAALSEIRQQTTANLSVDLQENWRLAERVAPFVDKIRYNPGHLHHSEPEMSWQEKVKRIAAIAEENDCALRVGVNCGSIDPNQTSTDDPILISALEHTQYLDSIGFTRYCVSLKSSDAATVIAVNRRFAAERPDVPLHLGVTEAGMPPEGIMKSRLALETLLSEGIGDTIRVSLTVSNERKTEEIKAGRLILDNVSNGIVLTERDWQPQRLNIVSCPSCARVQNAAFVELAQRVREATKFASDLPITIAVMGCRVNGPGETDNADIGLWCGANQVNLKRGGKVIGAFGYDEVIGKLLDELATYQK